MARKQATEGQRKLRMPRKRAMDEVDPETRKKYVEREMVVVVDQENLTAPLKVKKDC